MAFRDQLVPDPASDITRAKQFYETVCDIRFEQLLASPAWRCGASPADWQQGEISGALVCGEGAVPSATGTAVFLTADPDLQAMLDRVEPAGGRILIAKTAIGMEGAGHFAMIADTEGNTVGLYSRA